MVTDHSSHDGFPVETRARLRPLPFRGCKDRKDVYPVAIRSNATGHSLACHARQRVPNRRFARPPEAGRMRDLEFRFGDETGCERIPATDLRESNRLLFEV